MQRQIILRFGVAKSEEMSDSGRVHQSRTGSYGRDAVSTCASGASAPCVSSLRTQLVALVSLLATLNVSIISYLRICILTSITRRSDSMRHAPEKHFVANQ
jgi:hypothetical protein